VSPEAIGAILLGLTGLVTAIGTVTSNRNRRIDLELQTLRADLGAEREQRLLAERYIARLQRALARADLDVPPPPEGFGDDHPDEAAPASPTGRRHRRRA
jgi:hypothetical protein